MCRWLATVAISMALYIPASLVVAHPISRNSTTYSSNLFALQDFTDDSTAEIGRIVGGATTAAGEYPYFGTYRLHQPRRQTET